MTDYLDSGTVYVNISVSGVESKTGSGVDAATVRVSLVPYGYEGDFAISDATGVVVAADSGTVSGDPQDPQTDPVVVHRGNFIGEGLLRRNYHATVALARFEGLETNRFTGVLGYGNRSS